MQPLKIAQISTPMERTPPLKYGGTELVVSELTEELVKRGHRVTLFATGDSQTKAKLISAWPRGAFHDNEINPEVAHHLLFLKVLKQADEFDIIHSHNGWRFLPYLKFIKKPVVNTYHSYFFSRVIPLFDEFKKYYFTSISQSQQKPVPNLNFVDNVYNGINPNQYSFSDKEGKYFCFLGRIDRDKGVKEAVTIAQKTNIKLLIAARIEEKYQKYFDWEIKPQLNKKIIFIGEVGGRSKQDFLAKASGLLFPIDWEEPFGLVMIEAMACGTPVIAFDRGSVPEVIKDGKTGFICPQGDLDCMIKAIKKITRMPTENYKKMRDICREHVEANFTLEKMVDGYEKVYKRVIEDYKNKSEARI